MLTGGIRAWGEFSRPAARLSMPPLPVIQDSGSRGELRSLARGSPALLLPIFTRCAGACPVATETLSRSLAGHPGVFRAILLSFDPGDRTRDLADFRRRHGLPPEWILARGQDPAQVRALLDQMGFFIMKSEAGFNHPDAVFAFSARGTWVGTLSGGTLTPVELARAEEWVRAADAAAAAGEPLDRDRAVWAAAVVTTLCVAAIFWSALRHGAAS